MNDLFKKGMKQAIEDEDMGSLPDEHSAKKSSKRFAKILMQEQVFLESFNLNSSRLIDQSNHSCGDGNGYRPKKCLHCLLWENKIEGNEIKHLII